MSETKQTTDPQAPVEPKVEEVVETTTEPAESLQNDSGVDYKKRLEEEVLRNQKAGHAIQEAKKANKDLKKENEALKDIPAPEIDYDEIDRRIDERAEKKIEQLRVSTEQESIDEVVGLITNDPDRAELVKYHYNNTIKHSGFNKGDIVRDIKRAALIADQGNLAQQNQELIAALDSAQGVNRTGQPNSQPPQNSDTVMGTLSTQEEALAQRKAVRDNISIEEARKVFIAAKNS